MRILYIDIDSLRPDHLGCYGYHRNTSPNIDAIAADGVRFNNVYTPDALCLPSTSLKIHTNSMTWRPRVPICAAKPWRASVNGMTRA
jgi:hypothetical protein